MAQLLLPVRTSVMAPVLKNYSYWSFDSTNKIFYDWIFGFCLSLKLELYFVDYCLPNTSSRPNQLTAVKCLQSRGLSSARNIHTPLHITNIIPQEWLLGMTAKE